MQFLFRKVFPQAVRGREGSFFSFLFFLFSLYPYFILFILFFLLLFFFDAGVSAPPGWHGHCPPAAKRTTYEK
jgi:hypothetical protein